MVKKVRTHAQDHSYSAANSSLPGQQLIVSCCVPYHTWRPGLWQTATKTALPSSCNYAGRRQVHHALTRLIASLVTVLGVVAGTWHVCIQCAPMNMYCNSIQESVGGSFRPSGMNKIMCSTATTLSLIWLHAFDWCGYSRTMGSNCMSCRRFTYCRKSAAHCCMPKAS